MVALLGDDNYYVDNTGIHYIPKAVDLNDTKNHISCDLENAPCWAVKAMYNFNNYKKFITNWLKGK